MSNFLSNFLNLKFQQFSTIKTYELYFTLFTIKADIFLEDRSENAPTIKSTLPWIHRALIGNVDQEENKFYLRKLHDAASNPMFWSVLECKPQNTYEFLNSAYITNFLRNVAFQ